MTFAITPTLFVGDSAPAVSGDVLIFDSNDIVPGTDVAAADAIRNGSTVVVPTTGIALAVLLRLGLTPEVAEGHINMSTRESLRP